MKDVSDKIKPYDDDNNNNNDNGGKGYKGKAKPREEEEEEEEECGYNLRMWEEGRKDEGSVI